MFDLADKEIVKSRLKTCENCEFSKTVLGVTTCGSFGVETENTCGCIVKAKTQFANQKCPSGKW